MVLAGRALVTSLIVLVALPAGAIGRTSAKVRDRALDRAVERLVEMKGGPPGAAAIVQRGVRPRLHTAGVAKRHGDTPIVANDYMRLASVSKAFSGAAALALVDQGKLSLGDTIAARVPGMPAAWGAVTLRQLLDHTSGLPNYAANKTFLDQFAANPRAILTPRELIAFVAGEPLQFQPGTSYAYSNTDNLIIGLMVEAATGQSYDGALASLVYGPLGLRRTSLPTGYTLPWPYVHGYDVAAGKKPADVSQAISMAYLWAAGGIVSTQGDLNRFIRGYVGKRLFGAATRVQQLRFVKGSSQPPGPGRNSAGLGIFRYRTRCGTVYGHTGNLPGYTQFAAANRSATRSVVFTVNTQLSPDSGRAATFAALRRAYELAVCAALA